MNCLRHFILLVLAVALTSTLTSTVSAQNSSAQALPDVRSRASSGEQEQTQGNLSPQKGWPEPVDDRHKYTYALADVLEYRPKGDESDFRWDVETWHGGDYNRLWFKSEGQQNTAFKPDYDLDAQLLYGRFIKRYYDFQVGVRVETETTRLFGNATRAHAVIGLEGLAPYNYEIQPTMFISQNGDVSFRFTGTKDLLITQRLILQPRLELNAAVQEVERFSTGTGLNDIEFGLRLRYEIRRQFAPYIGVSLERSFFDTAKFVREDGGDPRQIRFVVGLRLWH